MLLNVVCCSDPDKISMFNPKAPGVNVWPHVFKSDEDMMSFILE